MTEEADVEEVVKGINRLVTRARAHAGGARTAFNEARKNAEFEDHVDEAQTMAVVSIAESLSAATTAMVLALEEK